MWKFFVKLKSTSNWRILFLIFFLLVYPFYSFQAISFSLRRIISFSVKKSEREIVNILKKKPALRNIRLDKFTINDNGLIILVTNYWSTQIVDCKSQLNNFIT